MDLTNNIPLKIVADADADNNMRISAFEAGTLATDWVFEVREERGRPVIYTTDQAGGITVDTQALTLDLALPAGILDPGKYYYILKANTTSATQKYRFGGTKQLEIVKF